MCDSIMNDFYVLEHATLKAPFEVFERKFLRTQNILDATLFDVEQIDTEMQSKICTGTAQVKDATNLLCNVAKRIKSLKRKASDSIAEEFECGQVCKRRIEHIKGNEWILKRMDRMLVEYFLRNGHYNSAICLANKSNVNGLTNIDMFLASRDVEESLANHQLDKCFVWCHENQSKLNELQSTLELNLCAQQFIELIRAGHKFDAVTFARQHFAKFKNLKQFSTLQRCMALLVMSKTKKIKRYEKLMNEDRWNMLIHEFRLENCRVFELNTKCLLTVCLQAGLSALKTPHCYAERNQRNPCCPVCQENCNKLADTLPFANYSHSMFFCRISGQPINENNMPMMLPNGQIYGELALRQLANENNGKIICPKTKEEFMIDTIEKVFIM